MSRPCGHCDAPAVGMDVGPDPCLARFDGVAEACCGHGWQTSPYVLLEDGTRLEQRAAIRFFDEHGVGPPPVETVTVPMFDQYDGQIRVTAEYRYENGRLNGIYWQNDSGEEPTWSFDGVVAKLTRDAGRVPLPDLVCSVDDEGRTILPFRVVESVTDAG